MTARVVPSPGAADSPQLHGRSKTIAKTGRAGAARAWVRHLISEEEAVNEFMGEDSVRAWLVIAAIFVSIGVIGLLGNWEGVIRSAMIGGSTALMAGLVAIVLNSVKLGRR